MANDDAVGFRRLTFGQSDSSAHVRIVASTPLHRIMGFLGVTIHDVVNCKITKNKVLGYYRLTKWVNREADRSDLERQWNPLGLSSR